LLLLVREGDRIWNSHDDSNEFRRRIVERGGELASGEDYMPAAAYCRIAPEEPTAPGRIRKPTEDTGIAKPVITGQNRSTKF
jgi:hypothetical protein